MNWLLKILIAVLVNRTELIGIQIHRITSEYHTVYIELQTNAFIHLIRRLKVKLFTGAAYCASCTKYIDLIHFQHRRGLKASVT